MGMPPPRALNTVIYIGVALPDHLEGMSTVMSVTQSDLTTKRLSFNWTTPEKPRAIKTSKISKKITITQGTL